MFSISNCVLLLSVIAYKIAIYKYLGATLINKAVFHHGIALMIGANACTWILITVNPLYESGFSNLSADDINDIDNMERNSSINAVCILEIVEVFFQPYLVEFLTISSGCLLTLWHTMRYDPRSQLTRPIRRTQFSEDILLRNYDFVDSDQA